MSTTHRTLPVMALLALAFLASACQEDATDIVAPGIYEGRIDELAPARDGIHVTLDRGERVELYFNEETRLVEEGQSADYSDLETGTRVRVTLTLNAGSNEPEVVEILR